MRGSMSVEQVARYVLHCINLAVETPLAHVLTSIGAKHKVTHPKHTLTMAGAEAARARALVSALWWHRNEGQACCCSR